METKHRLLNLTGLANRLDLPKSWLRKEAEAGRIPCLQIGRKMLFNESAVQDALLQQAANDEGCGK